jgi:hypothetical protein
MHIFFESLAITNTLGLQASLMDIDHDTSFRFIERFHFQSSHLSLFGQGGGAIVDCWTIYMFVPHRTFYFHFDNALSFQFDSIFNI